MMCMKAITPQEAELVVSDILTRGVGEYVDPDGRFRKKLIAKATGELHDDIIIKFGVDPTRPDIHLGHAVVLRKLRKLQDIGCKVVFLIGDYTAQIGDPTGKSKVRPEVEQSAIERNMQTYLEQAGKILSTDPSVFSWIRNSDWFLSPMDLSLPDDVKVEFTVKKGMIEEKVEFPSNSFIGKSVVFDQTRMQSRMGLGRVVNVSLTNMMWNLKHITHAQLVERDMFQKRITEGESLFMHEMFYPILQGTDSDVLHRIYGSCDCEVGGTDQTFNMLMGRKIMEINHHEPQAVLSFALLVGLDGKEKMSKSLDNYIGVTDTPTDMFGKVMSISDAAIPSYLELCTFTPMDDVRTIVLELERGTRHPKEVKMDLAQQIVEIYHGKEAGNSARAQFVHTFEKKGIPDEMPEIGTKKGTLLSDTLTASRLVESKSEFRRLLNEGALRKDGEEKITDPMFVVSESIVLKIGKHRFVRIIAS